MSTGLILIDMYKYKYCVGSPVSSASKRGHNMQHLAMSRNLLQTATLVQVILYSLYYIFSPQSQSLF
jgi:hypothetical protein